MLGYKDEMLLMLGHDGVAVNVRVDAFDVRVLRPDTPFSKNVLE